MHVARLVGPAALSPRREDALLAQLHTAGAGGMLRVTGRFVHLAVLRGALSAAQQTTLDRLLQYGPPRAPQQAADVAGDAAVVRVHVVPRPGTRSPWSSKASDIVRACGLGDVVERLERGVVYELVCRAGEAVPVERVTPLLHDRMTQSVFVADELPAEVLRALVPAADAAPPAVRTIALGTADRRKVLGEVSTRMGLALSGDELDYLATSYESLGRDPTDVELMMFAQVNSEHCRHKVFRAHWTVKGKEEDASLFDMIRVTHARHPNRVLSAYSDNGAVLRGHEVPRLFAQPGASSYAYVREQTDIVIKVETHNHPTAVSPYPGAATGSGGEIRDEGAVGRGAVPKAGLVGFAVSDLHIPGYPQPWEHEIGRPNRIASALDIMLEAPIGAAAFNNEFGRPNICGFFRTLTTPLARSNGATEVRGYHKPIMIAGGLGAIRQMHTFKKDLHAGDKILVLGGPAMLIGLGGGAASSVASGASSADLDFASVQRDNAEMQRRCQEVINQCWAQGEANPIISIHDVGAGGLSNALPEIVEGSVGHLGAVFDLRAVPSDDPAMTPLEIWCNEAQERYVLAVQPTALEGLLRLCERERAPIAVVGEVTPDAQIVLRDALHPDQPHPIDLPMSVLFGKTPRMHRVATAAPSLVVGDASWWRGLDLKDAFNRVLHVPSVASKNFLITIGDRTVGGQVARDQMVGPWQTPVSDVAVTTASFRSYRGEAMAMGERTPLALANAAASVRMAVGEALTNLLAADVDAKLHNVALSANWMVSAGHPGEDLALFEAVRAVSVELCVQLGIPIPVGKDSMSMKTRWTSADAAPGASGKGGASQTHEVTAPLSLVVSAFAVVDDVRRTLTPQLHPHATHDSPLVLFDLSGQHRDVAIGAAPARLGGSALAQAYQHVVDGAVPDMDDAAALLSFAAVVRAAAHAGHIVAYHDRSDGGLLTTVAEMAFAARTSVRLELDVARHELALPLLFAEELGVVVQVHPDHVEAFWAAVRASGLAEHAHAIGVVPAANLPQGAHEHAALRRAPARLTVVAARDGGVLLDEAVVELLAAWADTSSRMQALRDNAECAHEELAALRDASDPGMAYELTFDLPAPVPVSSAARVAVLREEGVNGHLEMAAAFVAAGFDAVDVHMTDVLSGRVRLDGFRGLAACGGFSYGDVLGAGEGWAKSILFNDKARGEFAAFFARPDTFTLGVCNGCQMLSNLKELIPGADLWPKFVRNRSEQFEARFGLVRVEDGAAAGSNRSVLLRGMERSRFPIAIAHGEGRAQWTADATADETRVAALEAAGCVVLRYVDNHGQATMRYPANPNGSAGAIAGVCSRDGRVTILMPHPERVARWVTNSWFPASLRPSAALDGGAEGQAQAGPWQKLFDNARVFLSSAQSAQ